MTHRPQRRDVLAYLFWHRSKPTRTPETYEADLRSFHADLAAAAPAGFVRSMTYRIADPPWLAGSGQAYEDWYLLENSAALDSINEAAVSGPRSRSHGRLAEAASHGAGGLYQSRSAGLAEAGSVALWFAKPAGSSYADVIAHIGSAAPDGALWRRQLVLGPAPEFCLICSHDLALPGVTVALRSQRTLVERPGPSGGIRA